jgi:MFS family permease
MLKSFLSNHPINLLNVHYVLQTFANNMVDLFIGVFLYQAGIHVYLIFIALAASLVVRMVLRPIALKLCHFLGLKPVLILGTIFYAVQFLILGQIENLGFWFLLFFFIHALTDVLYWLPYHTTYALLGDNNHRGKQTGLRDGLTKISGSLAPFLSGILVLFFGYWSAFILASVVMLLSIIPILKLSHIDLKQTGKPNRKNRSNIIKGFWLYVGDGFWYMQSFVWSMVLFLIVLNPAYFGGLIALTVLVKFFLNILVGDLFDNGKGKIVSRLGTFFIVLAVLGRSFFVDTIPEVIIFNIFFAIGLALYMPIFDSAFYNFSKSSKNPLRYHYFAEIGWDIGAISASLLTALIVYLSWNFRFAMLLSLLGLLITNYILANYFLINGHKKA